MPNTRVDYFAHVGGLVYGILLTMIIFQQTHIEDQPQGENHMQNVARHRKIKFAAIVVLAVVTVGFTISLFVRKTSEISQLGFGVCLILSLF